MLLIRCEEQTEASEASVISNESKTTPITN